MIDATALTTGAFTLGGAAVGLAGGSTGRIFRDRQERSARQQARQDAREDRQRRLLLDFQEALDLYLRAVWDAHYWEVKVAKSTGAWGGTPRPVRLDHEVWESSRRARQLAAWLPDEELRNRFGALDRRITSGLSRLSSEAAAVKFLRQVTSLGRLTQDRLGQVTRPLL
ncbi:MAG TPA: hypothetical protein VI138_01700 [Candidatus Dormibacteraeota bacterium]